MPYAITLLLDNQSAEKIYAMYKVLSDLKISHDQINLGYPPHLTLATLDDKADVQEIVDNVSYIAGDWRSCSVNLVGFGLFPGMPSTLWVCPAMTAELFQRHAALCAVLPASLLKDYYRPNRWIPHVTLAKDLAKSSAALIAVQDLGLPIKATFVEINLVQFRPPNVLWRLPLECM